MREILFKAKRESNRKWVEGYYYKENFLTGKSVQHFIRGKDDTDYVVCGETVSQYTGFQDRSDNTFFLWKQLLITEWKSENTLCISVNPDSGILSATMQTEIMFC